jgi:hypothetical protein
MCRRFLALCAYVRMVWASFYTVFFSDLNPQVYFCDQVCKYGFTRMLLMSYLITFSYSSGINVHTSFKDIHTCASRKSFKDMKSVKWITCHVSAWVYMYMYQICT